MDSSFALFNTLPSLEQANNKFSNHKSIFPKLVEVLTGYEDKFGINLVHRHTTLKEGEKMVTIGNVTEPMKDVECYPERWLGTGQAYVFNTKPTESPPKDLLEKLKAVVDAVGYIGGVGVLGLAYIKNLPKVEPGEVLTEITEGRVDIIKHGPENQKNTIATCWKSDGRCMVIYSSMTLKSLSRPHGGHGLLHHGDKAKILEMKHPGPE